MKTALEKLFGFDSAKHSVRTEIMAGITSFLTMAYILAVLVLSLLSKGSLQYEMVDYSMGNVFSEGTFQLFLHKGMEVGKSLFLVVLFFFVLQFLVLRLPKSKIFQILF